MALSLVNIYWVTSFKNRKDPWDKWDESSYSACSNNNSLGSSFSLRFGSCKMNSWFGVEQRKIMWNFKFHMDVDNKITTGLLQISKIRRNPPPQQFRLISASDWVKFDCLNGRGDLSVKLAKNNLMVNRLWLWFVFKQKKCWNIYFEFLGLASSCNKTFL